MFLMIGFAIDYTIYGTSFSPCITSFWEGLYLSMVTITTLGYGDLTPESSVFKVVSGIEAMLGVLILGLFLNSLFQEKK